MSKEELVFASEDEALQYLADITKKQIKVAAPKNTLVKIFMERDGMSEKEAQEYVQELQDRAADGEDPEELLYDEGLEPDYVFDLLSL